MHYIKKTKATDVAEVVEQNVGMPAEEFLKDRRFPYIKNIKEAVKMTKDFISSHSGALIACVGDYDVDGLAATSIIEWIFKKMGVALKVRIPRRMSEGYGLSEKIIDELGEGPGLIITVDNGISAFNAIQKAKDKGFTVIVTDHHLPPKDKKGNMILPPADLIVDPHIEDESEFKPLCGAALAFYFAKEMFPEAVFNPLLVLASIATVTDVMPLVSFNRTLVKDGLEAINVGKVVPGLAALIDTKELSVITEEDYGFLFGPVFNACGRLIDDGGDKVINVLGSTRSNPALPWQVQELLKVNEKRKAIVKESMVIAESLITNERPIVIYNSSFKEGVVGIIAGQLSDKYNSPAVVFTRTESGIYKGSARSTKNIHLKNALDKMSEYMLGYGGHAGAAGISVQPEKFEEFKEAFIKNVGTEEESANDKILYDLDISQNHIFDVIEELKVFAPYGEGNPKLTFHAKFDLSNGIYSVMGDGSHFSIAMDGYKIVGFGMSEKYQNLGCPKIVDAVCHISEDWFRGNRTVRVELVDFMAVS